PANSTAADALASGSSTRSLGTTTPGQGWCHVPCRRATRKACSPMALARVERRWAACRVSAGMCPAWRIGRMVWASAANLWTTEKYPIGLWITGLVSGQHADVRRKHAGGAAGSGEFGEFGVGVEVTGWDLGIEVLEGLQDEVADRPVAVPLAVGRDHVPGGGVGGAVGQRVGVGPLVVVPFGAGIEVGGVVLPVLCRVLEPGDQALLLLVLGDVQEALDQHGACGCQLGLELVD